MAFILHPFNYAIKKTVNAVLKTPERGARISGITTDHDITILEHEALAFDPVKGFKPTWHVPLRRPRTDKEAQSVYNHIRTLAWYADSLPLPVRLPFDIGIDAIIGFIPYLGDALASLIGLYLIYLVALFGVPFRILGIMLLLVIADTLLGAIPILGDAIDVAFKSNIYILHLFEHQLTQSRGKCSAGEFHIVMPPSSLWMPSKSQMKQAQRERQHLQQQQQQHTNNSASSSSSSNAAPAYRMTTLQSHMPLNPEDDPPEYAAARYPLMGQQDYQDTAGSAGPRAIPAAPPCDLPAMPLSLPPQFMSGGHDQHARDTSDVPSNVVHTNGHQPRTRHRTSSSSSASNNHRESVLYSNILGGVVPADAISNGGNEADSEISTDGEGDAHDLLTDDDDFVSPSETTKMLNGPRTPGPRRPRGVSWHTDTAGGLDDDWPDEDDVERNGNATMLAPMSPSFPLTAASPTSSIKGRRRRYLIIYSAIFAVAYVTSLDANTGYLYLNFACSEFGALASFSTVAICQQMIYAIAKPPIAKLSDVFGRAEALLFSLSLYSMGYACVATATSLQTLIGGIILQSAGNTGVQVLQSIIIADLTTAKWRGLVISLVNLPYLINFAVAGPLVDAVMQSSGWRVGYGMWILIVPLAAAPLVLILAVGQRQARNAGLLERRRIFGRGCGAAIGHLATEIDAIGLLLFTFAWTLILGPLTMAGHGSFSDQSWAAGLILTGFVLLGLFVFWETKASNPIMPLRFLKNRAVVCVCLIGILDFASFYLSWTYLSAFVQIVKGWGQTQTGYFATTQNVTSTVVGILVGSLMACTRRFKMFLVGGVLVRIIGVGLMIRYRNAHDPTIMLVLCQLLQGIGGGSVAITMQIAAQICVRHADVAIVTALELLTTEIGAAMGSATAGMIFTTLLPGKLRINLPDMSEVELLEVYGSLSKVTSYPLGSFERSAIADAWTQTMRELCIMATFILLPAIPLALAIPDFILPDSHRKNRASHHHHHHHHHSRSSMTSSSHTPSGGLNGSSSASSPSSRFSPAAAPSHHHQRQYHSRVSSSENSSSPYDHHHLLSQEENRRKHRRHRRRGRRDENGKGVQSGKVDSNSSPSLTRPPYYSRDSGLSSTSSTDRSNVSHSEQGQRAEVKPRAAKVAGEDSDADHDNEEGGSRTPQPYQL